MHTLAPCLAYSASKDVLAVVESTYLEEERAVRNRAEQERRDHRELSKQLEAAEDAANRQFEVHARWPHVEGVS